MVHVSTDHVTGDTSDKALIASNAKICVMDVSLPYNAQIESPVQILQMECEAARRSWYKLIVHARPGQVGPGQIFGLLIHF